MAEGIRYLEGFETDDLLTVWEDPGSTARTTTAARSGTYGLQPTGLLGFGTAQSPLFACGNEISMGFAFRPRSYILGSLPNNIFVAGFLIPPGNVVANLHFTQQRTFGVNGQYGLRSLELDAWYYIEWYLKAHASNARIIIRINGDVELDVSGLAIGTDAYTFNQFYIGTAGAGNDSTEFHYDDIYVRDAEVEGAFLGDQEIIGVGLDGDISLQWTRNGGSFNYQRLIENTPDEDVTYVENQTGGLARDVYSVGDIPVGFTGQLNAVQLVSRGRKTSTHLWHHRVGTKVGANEELAPNIAMSFPNYETYPPRVFGHQPNGSPWDIASFNNLQVINESEPFNNTPGP